MKLSLPSDRRRQFAVGAVAVSVVVSVGLFAGCGSTPPPQPTARVERGQVATKVSASGALASVTSQNLGFPKGAQLKEINVKVGDVVRPGQVLAKEDQFPFQQLLNQQQAQLLNQQAILNRLINGNTVQQAQRSLDQSEDILDATRKNVDAAIKSDDTTVDRAQVAASEAQRQLSGAQRNLDFCRTHAAAATGTTPNLLGGPGQSGVSPSYNGAPTPLMNMTGMLTNQSRGNPNRDGTVGRNPSDYYGMSQGGADPCTAQVGAVNNARTQAIQTQTNLAQAQKQRKLDRTQGQVSIENAKQSVVTNQNNLDSAKNDTPANIAAQRGLVDNARAAVALAQRDLDNTVLIAPVGGTVSTINGTLNEYVGPETGLTSQAPGSNAAIPGVGAAATSAQNQISVSTNGSRNGGTFLVLNNVDSFQVVVPFEESDAAKVQPNAPVEVTFDAIPDLVRQGKVLSIAPTGTDISGVTNYYATVLLTETDPRLKDGQTAEAGVLTSSKNDVLVVPNNAIIKQGGQSFVSVPGADGKPSQVPFQPGVVGDDRTEVLSGLHEGQQILLPQAQVNSTPGGGSGGPRGGGGGGGGGGGR